MNQHHLGELALVLKAMQLVGEESGDETPVVEGVGVGDGWGLGELEFFGE